MADNYWSQPGADQQQPTQQMPQVQQYQQQPYQQYQPQYQQPQPVQVQPFAQPEASSLGSWVLTLFLAAIPIVGLVLLFVWAFGSTPDVSKKNWARANLIWVLVAIVIYTILFFVMGVSITSLYSNGYLS